MFNVTSHIYKFREMIIHRFFWFLSVLIELFFFGGVVFGFPFIEFELKKEGVFYETACANGPNDSSDDGKTLCNKALKIYNTLFEVSSLICMLGALLVGALINKFGIFWTRMIYCTATSLGKIVRFLKTSKFSSLFDDGALQDERASPFTGTRATWLYRTRLSSDKYHLRIDLGRVRDNCNNCFFGNLRRKCALSGDEQTRKFRKQSNIEF